MATCAVRNRVISDILSDENGFSSSSGQFPSEDFMDLDEFLSASGLNEQDSESTESRSSSNSSIESREGPQTISAINCSRTRSKRSSEASNHTFSSGSNLAQLSETKSNENRKHRNRRSSSSDSSYVYKPAPIFKKSKRHFTPDDSKDDKYWERRIKNNVAAKRSRDMRREKEIEIAEMCKNLEDENSQLKEEIFKLEAKARELEEKVAFKTTEKSK